jgi:hypothetical protein
MRCVRALPILQLMLAVGSRKVRVAAPLLGGLPGKTQRPHPFASPHAGHPSIIMSPDQCPWTQIRLGAGTPHASPAPCPTTGGSTCLESQRLCLVPSAVSMRSILARLKVVRPHCAAGAPP